MYAKALLPPTEEVYLWLGVRIPFELLLRSAWRFLSVSEVMLTAHLKANVMLAYPMPEAIDMLKKKLQDAREKSVACEEDLDFLRDQITVSH